MHLDISDPPIRCYSTQTALLVLDPSDGVFGRFDLAALCGCHTLNVCCCCCLSSRSVSSFTLAFKTLGQGLRTGVSAIH